MQDNEGKFD